MIAFLRRVVPPACASEPVRIKPTRREHKTKSYDLTDVTKARGRGDDAVYLGFAFTA